MNNISEFTLPAKIRNTQCKTLARDNNMTCRYAAFFLIWHPVESNNERSDERSVETQNVKPSFRDVYNVINI